MLPKHQQWLVCTGDTLSSAMLTLHPAHPQSSQKNSGLPVPRGRGLKPRHYTGPVFSGQYNDPAMHSQSHLVASVKGILSSMVLCESYILSYILNILFCVESFRYVRTLLTPWDVLVSWAASSLPLTPSLYPLLSGAEDQT